MSGAARGIEIARELALLGAETAVVAPKERLPFEESGPAAHADRWRALGQAMRDHERSDDPDLFRLREAFSLTSPEYWLVMLCAAAERYTEAAAAFGILMDENHAHLLTPLSFALLMHATGSGPVEESLTVALGGGTPRRLGLVESIDAAPGRPLTHQPIRLAAAEIRNVIGARGPLPSQTGASAAREPAFEDSLLRFAARLLEHNRVLLLRGPSHRSLRQFALDLGLWVKAPARFSSADDTAQSLLPALRLRGELPVIDATTAPPSPQLSSVVRDAAGAVKRLVVLTSDGFAIDELPSFPVPRLRWREAERIWRAATGDAGMAKKLASRFRVNSLEADAACRHADDIVSVRPSTDDTPREQLIADHVLQEGARRMSRLVTHLSSDASLDDLVVPERLRVQLTDIINWNRHSARVFDEMGVGRHTPLGRGLTCLFSGPSGTGKTFATQCLANELGLNLYRIDLSQVVSKYIGETEKALSTIFDEAEAGHGVLLFDEADALFGKRSEVKDAHDRYANIEVGYLLQRLEAYEGVAILATNLRSNIDPAFMRRIRFHLEFPMPDVVMRGRLWEQSLPGRNYRADELDLTQFVQRFRLSGGSIQNISLAASHMAAATTDARITPEHLVRATYRELEKAGHSHDRASFGALADHLAAEVV